MTKSHFKGCANTHPSLSRKTFACTKVIDMDIGHVADRFCLGQRITKGAQTPRGHTCSILAFLYASLLLLIAPPISDIGEGGGGGVFYFLGYLAKGYVVCRSGYSQGTDCSGTMVHSSFGQAYGQD
jgi:hypothetical protein